MLDTLSHAALLRLTAREIDRTLLARELARIYDATHVAAARRRIYRYGTEAECRVFATGLRGVQVRAITDGEQAELARHKRRAWRVT